jgi:hypothetical protein
MRIQAYTAEIEAQMRNFYNSLSEQHRRRYVAVEALKLGYGWNNLYMQRTEMRSWYSCTWNRNTSKYNPIEHRLFSYVSKACQGVIFSSIERVHEVMSKTKTSKGLKVFTSIVDKTFER